MKRTLIMGLVLLLLVSASFAFGAGYAKNITIYEGVVQKIFVNGIDKTSEENKPFIYEGSTYVPLRYISEALGQTVEWDGEQGYIYIGQKPTTLEVTEAYLTDLPLYATFGTGLYRINNQSDSNHYYDNDGVDDITVTHKMSFSRGTVPIRLDEYDKGIITKAYDEYQRFQYTLGGKYDSISGSVGYDYFMNQDREIYPFVIKLIADEKVVKTISISEESPLVEFSAPLNRAEDLKIEITSPSGEKQARGFINMVDLKVKGFEYK